MVLLKVGILFALIVVLLRLKTPFSLVILIAAVALGLWFGLNLKNIGNSALDTLQDSKTISLAVAVALILVLSELLKASGQLSRISKSIVALLGLHRLTYTVLPAFLGFLPMPGGALFSAPLLDDVSDEVIPAHKKTVINYWFRHIWEYAWPLYPGLILAASLTKVPLKTLSLFQSPFILISIIAGFFIVFPGIRIKKQSSEQTRAKLNLKELFRIIYFTSPIALVIILFIAFHLPMFICLLISIGWLILTILINKQLKPLEILKIFFTKLHVYRIILVVVTVLTFSGILKTSTLSADLISFFNTGANQIPFVYLMISAIALPFIVGMLTGMTIVFVGSTFPLIVAMVEPSGANIIPWAMLAYVSGFCGVMLSPLHLCLVLTTAYYGTTLMKVYRYLIPIALIVFLSGVIMFGILILSGLPAN